MFLFTEDVEIQISNEIKKNLGEYKVTFINYDMSNTVGFK